VRRARGNGRAWRRVGQYVALALALTVLVWPLAAHAIEVWSTDEEFTYGFLIPPIALSILWLQRHSLSRAIGKGSNGGLAVVAAAIVVMVVSRRTGIHNLAGLALTPLLIGIAAYLWGWKAARVAAFPSAFLIFGFGLYRGLLNSVGFVLQDLTATGAHWSARLVGLDIVRDGLVLRSASASSEYAFVVAQACSGMSSLLSLLALASILLYATRGPMLGRAVVLCGVLPVVVVANTLRVTLVLLVADHLGQDAALGFFHGLSSLVLFGLALVGLFSLSRMVGCKPAAFAR
jgi:exosortase